MGANKAQVKDTAENEAPIPVCGDLYSASSAATLVA
ncbi:MAG: hypothetical protein JWQ55_1318, partial [Rhodopila sp.]|nr:hypothetical protein [Rhodopila sp.]